RNVTGVHTCALPILHALGLLKSEPSSIPSLSLVNWAAFPFFNRSYFSLPDPKTAVKRTRRKESNHGCGPQSVWCVIVNNLKFIADGRPERMDGAYNGIHPGKRFPHLRLYGSAILHVAGADEIDNHRCEDGHRAHD